MMTDNFKPIFDQIKLKLGEPKQIREKIEKNVGFATTLVEQTAKSVFEEAKKSGMVQHYVLPALKSERADRAMEALTERLGKSSIVERVKLIRTELISQMDLTEAEEPARPKRSRKVEKSEK